jgi:hypothetical protein
MMQPTHPVIDVDQLAPGRYVHRRQLREVFLTTARRESPDAFVMGGQWPREHAFYSTRRLRPDSALVAETVRQATILLAHTMYDVPLDAAFLMPSLVARTHAVDDFWNEDELVVRADVTRVARSHDGVTALRVAVTIESAGQLLGDGVGDARIVGAGPYARLRAGRDRRPGTPLRRPSGARSPMLTWSDDGTATVGVDDQDPVFFDHPLDHVPGMLLLEAVREGVRHLAGDPALDLDQVDLAFRRVAEFDPPLTLSVSSRPDGRTWSVAVTQDGAVCVEGIVTSTTTTKP